MGRSRSWKTPQIQNVYAGAAIDIECHFVNLPTDFPSILQSSLSIAPHFVVCIFVSYIFPNCFFFCFFFAFSLAEEATAPESWPLSRTQTVVWPHFCSRLLHSQPKVDFCTKNGTSKIIFWMDLSSNSFKNWIYQNMVVPIQVALLIYNDLTDFFQNDETAFWHWKLTLKIKMWWFLTQLTQVTASSIEFTIAGSIFWVKVYIWLAVCSKSEVMLKDSTMLSVNVPWALLTPFLRIGARHRAFFSSLDLWRLVQETILYFQQLQWAVSFRLQNQWTLKFVTIATLRYIYKIYMKESSRNRNIGYSFGSKIPRSGVYRKGFRKYI